jgi:hypothetical protein
MLTNYVLVVLEFSINTGKDSLKTLASILITHLLIYQILREPRVSSWLATGEDRNIIFTLEERIIIEFEIKIRPDIRFAYGTTKSNSHPFSCKIDNDTVDEATLIRGELVIL